MKKFLRLEKPCPSLAFAVALSLGSGAALAAQPCPWQSGPESASCTQWEALAQRMESAEARASAAETAMQSMQVALKSMQIALNTDAANAAPAGAAATPEQRAKAVVDRFLDWLNLPLPENILSIKIDRNYQLKQKGDAYVATFPELAIVIDKARIDLGPLTFSIQPQASGVSHVAMRLGDTLTLAVRDSEFKGLQVAIGNQSMTGVWNETFGNFQKSQTQLDNLKITVTDQPISAELASFKGDTQLEVGADDTWKQQQALALSGLKVNTATTPFTVGAISGEVHTDGRNYSKMVNFGKDLAKMIAANADKKEPPPELFKMFGELYGAFARYSSNINATDVVIGAGDKPLARIAKLNIANGFDEGDGSGSQANYIVGLDGIQTGAPILPPNLTPNAARFEIGVTNLPPELMSKIITIGMEGEKIQDPAEKDAYFNQQFLALLQGSKAGLYIKDSFVGAPAARVDLNLNAKVNPESAMGGTGDLKLRLEGLQTVVDTLGLNQNEGVAPVVAMITAFSARTDENGKTVDSFDLQFTADGKLMLNGKDVTAMFMPKQGQGAQAEPPQEEPNAAEEGQDEPAPAEESEQQDQSGQVPRKQ
ncbi:MAG: hypothetical protein U1F68_06255 [Gammaproteobacteria bacterium]